MYSSSYSQQQSFQPKPFVEINTALFVDFDNIFIRLHEQDPALAEQFAVNPGQWLKWLTHGRFNVPQGSNYRRNILVRKCYLNPRSFHEYRPYFIKSAFNVVDCPTLTARGKTSADIHMVLDILDALNHPTHFDEFIIFSGDTDFTPVLIRLREYNRKTAILAVGPASPAYKSASNWLIREDYFIEGALGFRMEDTSTDSGPSVPPDNPDLTQRVAEFVKEEVAQSEMPINLPQLGEAIRAEFGTELPGEGWPGFSRLADYLTSLDIAPYEISGNAACAFDPERHKLPETDDVQRLFREKLPDLFPFALRVHKATDVPLMLPDHYRAFFNELADEVRTGYQLTNTSRNVRDRCLAKGLPVARNQVNFILIGISRVGYGYRKNGQDTPEALAKAFAKNVFDLCSAAQLDLSEGDVRNILRWILPKGDANGVLDPA